jgi:hypothetical protein
VGEKTTPQSTGSPEPDLDTTKSPSAASSNMLSVVQVCHWWRGLTLDITALRAQSVQARGLQFSLINTGYLISPSRISDLCSRVAGMVTPEGSMWTEEETLEVSVLPYRCSICPLLVNPDKCFLQTLDRLGRSPRPACSFRSAQAATLVEFHVPLTNCFVHMWRCVLHGPKPPLHGHNWLSFGKFQDTERFLIPCPRHVSSRLPPSGATCKYATVLPKQTWTDSVSIDMLLSAVSVLVVEQPSSEVPEGLTNYPVQSTNTPCSPAINHKMCTNLTTEFVSCWLQNVRVKI